MLLQRTICTGVFAICFLSCQNSKTVASVQFDAAFAGARMDSVEQLGAGSYKVHISPAFEPVNKSPYYAFAVSSPVEQQVEIQLHYGEYKHRYIPKISTNRESWEPLEEPHYQVDTISGTATLNLNVGPGQTFVAAQEIETSEDTYAWIDQLLQKYTELGIQKTLAGKTPLNRDNFCLQLETERSRDAIVLIARQHPPETPGGTIGFKAFFDRLLQGDSLAKTFRERFSILAFPLLNPDGADLGHWRHNANGKDLNRDWVEFNEPETNMVRSFLEDKSRSGMQYHFALDFHTSYSGPYLLILDSVNESRTRGIIPKWIQHIERNSNFRVEARRRSQELPYCYNWFFNRFGTEAVTYEEGDEVPRDTIRLRARRYANELMQTLIEMQEKYEFEN